jgi:MIP family channel proteins
VRRARFSLERHRTEPRSPFERDPEHLARQLVGGVASDPPLQITMDRREVAIEDNREQLRLFGGPREDLCVAASLLHHRSIPEARKRVHARPQVTLATCRASKSSGVLMALQVIANSYQPGGAAGLRCFEAHENEVEMKTAELTGTSTRAGDGAQAERPPAQLTIEPRTVSAYAAEGVGTFLLVFFICAVISVGNAGVLQLDLAGLGMLHALTLGVLVYALAASSGAHFNPAITVAMLAIRQIRVRDAAAYVVFQLAGGALAGLLVLLLFHHAGASVNYGATAIDAKVIASASPWLGLIAELAGTFMLMWAVMAVAVNPRGEKHFAGLVIGGGLGLAVMVFGPATGAGLNPARWLGPALVSGTYPDFWVFIVGPIAGALLAAFGYRALVLAHQPNTTLSEVSP